MTAVRRCAIVAAMAVLIVIGWAVIVVGLAMAAALTLLAFVAVLGTPPDGWPPYAACAAAVLAVSAAVTGLLTYPAIRRVRRNLRRASVTTRHKTGT